jgi:2-polyprenyl-3-methyl-5-hydroxy-6-metoxy-1,4-benzoquinol methylase
VRLVPSGSRVLDVGCASGYLGEALLAKDCTLVGIELNREAAAVARSSQAYEEIHELNLDNAHVALPPGPFDVVICADVIEHLSAPENALVRLCALLADGGRLILSVPNIAHITVRAQLLLGRFEYTNRGILDRTHLHFYTYRSAVDLIRVSGLEVDAILAGSNRFGSVLSFGPTPLRWLRGLLAYNIVLVARRRRIP